MTEKSAEYSGSLTRPRVLVAEDEPVSLRIMVHDVTRWGYEVEVASQGHQAIEILQSTSTIRLAILDWMMPNLDGVEIIRIVREKLREQAPYIILLTSKPERGDLLTAFEAGADDFLTKPYDPAELRARLKVGARVIELQRRLAERVRELEVAFSKVKQLTGLLPICAYCKRIRKDGSYWEQLESYICEHSEANFTHGVCPDCFRRVVHEEFGEVDETASIETTR